MRILILGVSGMLGNALFRMLGSQTNHTVFGSARSENVKSYFDEKHHSQIFTHIDIDNKDNLIKLFSVAKPEITINCIGVIKQLQNAKNPLHTLPINSLFPHQLAAICELVGSRLIQVSTDCVFSGNKGNYTESDLPDATDLYGRSKLLGEVDYPHAITLRTSIIGHELNDNKSLIGWFLSQSGSVNGFKKAVFSGVPTVELARIINQYVLPNPELHGLYHVAAEPINKYDLLKLVAETYNKKIDIIPSDELVIDRSLNATRFNKATGYHPPIWPDLIKNMHDFK